MGQETLLQILPRCPHPSAVADRCSDAFEGLPDPALFCSKGSTSQPSSSYSPQGITTLQSDGEDELDLPSLNLLLNRDPTRRLLCESHNTLGREKPTESTLQIQGWTEVPGPDGMPILQELSDHVACDAIRP